MIKKKDTKLQEIEKILAEEINPQLEVLKKEKDDYALFNSNTHHMEDYEKILVAAEYFEYD